MPTPAEPRYLTPRTSEYTYGGAIAKLARANRKPLMPWQRQAADLLTECDYDGRLIHPLGVITVQRQSGKTTLLTPFSIQRALRRSGQRIWITAQSGQMARELLLEQVDALAGSPVYPLLKVTRANANTSITVPANGSRIKAHPPTHDSLHGVQGDLNMIDEGWVFDTDAADALMAAITPTQATRPDPQTIVASTVGTAESVWFHSLVQRGRNGEFPLIDYGVPPGTDPDDIDTIVRHHPAVGFTQSRESILAARSTLTAAGYLRAYGNLETTRVSPLWSVSVLDRITDPTPMPDTARVAFGLAVDTATPSSAVIVAAGIDPAGVAFGELVEFLPTAEAPARALDLARRHAGAVGVDVTGPSLPAADALTRLAHTSPATVARYNGIESSSAAMELVERVDSDRVRVLPHPLMRAALESAATRPIGDRIVWARAVADGAAAAASIAPVDALGCAIRAALNARAPVAPAVHFA